MKSLLVAAVLSTIVAIESSAQAKPETVTVRLPGRPTPRGEVNAVRVFRGQEFAKDSVARGDTLAILQAVADTGGQVYAVFVDGDTAQVYGATEHTRVTIDTTAGGIVNLHSATGSSTGRPGSSDGTGSGYRSPGSGNDVMS